MLIFFLFLWGICLYKTSFEREKKSNEIPLNISQVIPLKGIMAIEIVSGHIYGQLNNNKLLYYNNRIGVWVVGVFFFLSGYGLSISYHKKQNYLKGFLIKRLGGIFLPFFLVFLANWFLGFDSHFGHYLINDWFVTEMSIVYILWYILYKYVPGRRACAILIVSIFALNILGTYYNIGSRWYGSTACFLFGIIFEKQEKEFHSYCQSYYVRILCISVLIFVLSVVVFFVGEDSKWIATLMINVTCIELIIIVYLLLMKFTIGNVYTIFLGRISWEIYVGHRTFIRIYERMEWTSDFLYLCVLFGSIILTSWVLWKICSMWIKCCARISG